MIEQEHTEIVNEVIDGLYLKHAARGVDTRGICEDLMLELDHLGGSGLQWLDEMRRKKEEDGWMNAVRARGQMYRVSGTTKSGDEVSVPSRMRVSTEDADTGETFTQLVFVEEMTVAETRRKIMAMQRHRSTLDDQVAWLLEAVLWCERNGSDRLGDGLKAIGLAKEAVEQLDVAIGDF